jgi:hypothetical protein
MTLYLQGVSRVLGLLVSEQHARNLVITEPPSFAGRQYRYAA